MYGIPQAELPHLAPWTIERGFKRAVGWIALTLLAIWIGYMVPWLGLLELMSPGLHAKLSASDMLKAAQVGGMLGMAQALALPRWQRSIERKLCWMILTFGFVVASYQVLEAAARAAGPPQLGPALLVTVIGLGRLAGAGLYWLARARHVVDRRRQRSGVGRRPMVSLRPDRVPSPALRAAVPVPIAVIPRKRQA